VPPALGRLRQQDRVCDQPGLQSETLFQTQTNKIHRHKQTNKHHKTRFACTNILACQFFVCVGAGLELEFRGSLWQSHAPSPSFGS
jgi:hypothetical protein